MRRKILIESPIFDDHNDTISGLKNGQDYSDKQFNLLQLDNAKIIESDFQGSVFQSCSFIESVFNNCRFEDCVFEKCNLSLIKLISSTFINVKFNSSKMVGIDWKKAAIPFSLNISFNKCNISDSSFLGLNLQNIKIIECIAHQVNFEDSNLANANLESTDFNKSRFQNTNLVQANFSNARNYSIDHKYNKLKKTIFSLPEAVSLLSGLDIILENK